MVPVLSITIPTYRRGVVILETIDYLRRLKPLSIELLIVDQTDHYPRPVAEKLAALDRAGMIRWLRLSQPSIPNAMNTGLQAARGDAVLFLDDDIIPDEKLFEAHLFSHKHANLVAGQVLQPGEQPVPLQAGERFRFNSTEQRWIDEFMGGNFSVKRKVALTLGGFDENFRGAAYRFEAEFANRYLQAHGKILFQPAATIHHLQAPCGGTRGHGHHLRTVRPNHSVGAYYYLLRARPAGWWRQLLWRPIRAVRTRHHLRRPWWVVPSLIAEGWGLCWALWLSARGPRLLKHEDDRLPDMVS